MVATLEQNREIRYGCRVARSQDAETRISSEMLWPR